MKITFRQGLARFQTDVLSTPTFLQKSAGSGTFVDLIVSPDPTIIVFAHKSANYIVEELKTVPNAWGPFTGSGTSYLFWDVNLLTGALTRGITLFPPIFAGTPPSVPVIDQHWFDTTETVMRVWNGAKWLDKIRVFAAYLTSNSIIHPYQLGSQCGITGDFEGGNIILDAYNKPLRQSDGSFVTSSTSLIISNNSAKKVKFETEALAGIAAEPLPKFSLVQMRAGRRLILARYPDFMTRIAGIVLEDLYQNEVGYITADGLVRNEGWNFPPSSVNRPVFCGPNGEVTVVPPTSGVVQVAGFVYDTDSIYMNIFAPVILEDITTYIEPPPPIPPVNYPVSDFYAGVTTGPAPLIVSFTQTALGSPTTFEWDFNNDTSVDASTPNAVYTYYTPGTYDVRLTTTNAFGSNTIVKQGYIVVQEQAADGLFTNLEVRLSAPNQANRNTSIPVSIGVNNDGALTATNVIRTITIKDLKNEQIQISGIPPGSTITRVNNDRTVIVLPTISILPSGSSYGPFTFNVISGTKSGDLVITASVSSPEVDSTIGDNSTSISITVK